MGIVVDPCMYANTLGFTYPQRYVLMYLQIEIPMYAHIYMGILRYDLCNYTYNYVCVPRSASVWVFLGC